ncbi:MAG: glycoside hydrolase domain-containing protein [Phyllobacterium sp.]|uniref:glycoside hydrolase domain-containing protein n=1 Tax=Phyllobacterium sp. TaxID=1871046 RepID=UPI0030F29A39
MTDARQADHKLIVASTVSKINTIDLPLAAERLKSADAASRSFAALAPRTNQVLKDIAAVLSADSVPAAGKAKLADFEKQTNAVKDDFAEALKQYERTIGEAGALIDKVNAALAAGDLETAAKLSAELAALPKALEALTKNIADKTAALDKRLSPLAGPWEEALEFPRPRSDVPLTQYVNLFVGTDMTDSGGGHSGNDNPGAQTPFGMVSFGPDTRGSGNGWGYGSGGYYYGDSSIQFFSMTHLNGPGCRGQGAVAMLPTNNATQSLRSGVPYSHANEAAEAGYYKVKLDNNIITEVTATPRTGMMRVTYPESAKAFLILNSQLNNASKYGVDTKWVDVKMGEDGLSLSGNATPGELRLRAKNKAGAWQNGGFHEGTEPHYIWAFAHDWSSLVEKLGGKTAAQNRLHTLFALDSKNPFSKEPTGGQLNSGESGSTFYIGNEPSFQTPWAYNWVGAPKYAQYVIPLIMRKNFSLGSGGLPGNDDMGATSAWYVLAALGLYPVIPSEPGLAVSTPQFKGISLWLGNGKKLRISTDKTAMLSDIKTLPEEARYIKAVKVNDVTYEGTWLPLDRIKDGGKLTFDLSATPTEWGSEWIPPSGPNADYSKPTAAPVSGVQVIQ